MSEIIWIPAFAGMTEKNMGMMGERENDAGRTRE